MNSKKITGYPSIDKPWLKYFSQYDKEMKVPACTIYQHVYDKNKDALDDVAILYFGNKITYQKLFQKIENCAKSLRKIGVKKGECVTLCTAAVPEAMYMVLACSRVGAIANFINPMFTKEQMIDRINDTDAKWLFVLDAMYTYIEGVLSQTCIENVVVISATGSAPPIVAKMMYVKSKARKILKEKTVTGKKYYSWNQYEKLGKSYKGEIDTLYEKDTPTVMVYSSGSTGASKGILLTNDGINSTIANYQTSEFHYDRSYTSLQIIPIWFSTGIVLSFLMELVNGVTVIPEPRYGKEFFIEDLIKYRPSICLVQTSFWLYAMDTPKLKDADLSHFVYPFTGGEKVTASDEERINDFFIKHNCHRHLYKGYGMCELGSTVATFSDAPGYISKPRGTGYPMLNAVVSAFDVDTQEELSYGKHGEIRVFSPGFMKGYYKNPSATSEFFKRDEKGIVWGCTGDIGYIDEDGEVFVLGRASDSCRSENGQLIYLFDIEDEILKCDSVTQCKVVDIKENGKTKLVAHVVLKEGLVHDETLMKDIYRSIKELLPDYMVPDYYKVRESMPIHVSGKRDLEALKTDVNDLRTFL